MNGVDGYVVPQSLHYRPLDVSGAIKAFKPAKDNWMMRYDEVTPFSKGFFYNGFSGVQTEQHTAHVGSKITYDKPGIVVRFLQMGRGHGFKYGNNINDFHERDLRYWGLHAMLKEHGDWMLLGGADEQKPAAEGTVEAWGRSDSNPVAGWYGMKKGLRGRFGVYLPPLMEALGLVELEHHAKNNRMRAI